MEAKTTTPAKTVTTRRCNCGCGEATSSAKTQYKPGHDARHVGSVARDFAAYLTNGGKGTTHSMLDELGSDKLRAKAVAMADRLVAKAAGKNEFGKPVAASQGQKRGAGARNQKAIAAKVAQEEAAHAEATTPAEPMWTEYEEGFLARVGRWEYPGRRYMDTDLNEWIYERNSKRDGSGEWLSAEYSQFK